MLLPQNMDIDFMSPFFADAPPYWADLVSNLFYAISLSLIEPMYVASGFMLYINRRTHLEGWDIELAFRRMAQRLSKLAGVTTALLLIPALLMTLPGNVDAAEPRPPADSRAVIEEVLAHEDFATSHTEEEWRLHDLDWNSEPDEEEDNGIDLDRPGWLDAFAMGVKAVIIATVIGVLLYILYRYRNEITGLRRPARVNKQEVPEAVLGMDIRPESLPEDIADAAARLWADGHYRDALSLFYRAALSHMLHHDAVSILDSDTEEDILRSASLRLEKERLDYLRLLTRSWQSIAYAHRAPAAETFEKLVFDWPQRFNHEAHQV
jgi:hypothetical protein